MKNNKGNSGGSGRYGPLRTPMNTQVKSSPGSIKIADHTSTGGSPTRRSKK